MLGREVPQIISVLKTCYRGFVHKLVLVCLKFRVELQKLSVIPRNRMARMTFLPS
jgi:hypothetical protein